MKTRPSICRKKARYSTRDAAEEVAKGAFEREAVKLRVYACELCRNFHLTSRTKGMKVPAYEREQLPRN
ncbi:MAG: hypothetical protein ABJG26_12655 [Marinomonas sp.]